MATLIRGGWIVGYDGAEHRLLRDGVVVYEEDRIVHVGKSYSGSVDEVIEAGGKVVSPGFLNTHCHAATPVNTEAFAIDLDLKAAFGNPNIPFAPPRDKIGKSRLSEGEFRAVATFSLCSLLKSGCTTIVEAGAGRDSLVELVGELGMRAYLGPGFRSAETYTGDDGTYYHKDWDDERGFRGLEEAIRFIEKHDGSYGGRVRGILVPLQADTCTPHLLREVRKVADDLGVGITIHAGQRIFEFQEILRRYKKTPIGFLESVGLLGPDAIVAHALMVSGHSWTAYPGDSDIRALARTGASVAHCPLVAARTSCALQSFGRYLRAGVNMTIGTDTWPQDIVSEMRWASIIGKLMEGDRSAASSREVFTAATLGGARALGRRDIGRLAEGAKADIVIIGTGSFRYAPVFDPIKSLVNAGTCDDVETVIVDGRIVVEGGKVVGVDEGKVIEGARRVAGRLWKSFPGWNWKNRDIREVAPLSFRPMEE